MAVTTNKEIMNTEWHFSTPIYSIMKPEWLTNDNGIWAFDESKLVEVLSNYMKNWLEDSLPNTLYEKMEVEFQCREAAEILRPFQDNV